MESWPGLAAWQDWGYLKARCGRRTVPVEVGRHYLAAQWGQRLISFSEFLDRLQQPQGAQQDSSEPLLITSALYVRTVQGCASMPCWARFGCRRPFAPAWAV